MSGTRKKADKKPAAKKPAAKPKCPRGMSKPIEDGLQISDILKKPWQLGPVIGQGGFGYLYLGGAGHTSTVNSDNADYVIKVEPHANGPLFSELAFYQRAAKADTVSNWMKANKRSFIGIPRYIASGSFEHNGEKFRFMVMNRFGTDLEKIFESSQKQFSEETAFSLGLRVLETLEYIHQQEYVHADIKSSNLMTGLSKSAEKQVYLLDYGLAYRYAPNGKHCPYKEDPKRKHDGTLLYTSIDAHKGCAPSRRGDLEILGYCITEWLCQQLPWGHIQSDELADKEAVMKLKVKYMDDIPSLMKACFKSKWPVHLQKYLEAVRSLEYDSEPDYTALRTILKDGLKKAGHTDDGKSVILPKPESTRGKRRSTADSGLPSPNKRVKASSPKPKPKPQTPAKNPKKSIASPKSPSRGKPPSKTVPVKSPKKTVPVSRTRSPAVKTPLKQITNENNSTVSISATKGVYRKVRRKNVKTKDFAQSP